MKALLGSITKTASGKPGDEFTDPSGTSHKSTNFLCTYDGPTGFVELAITAKPTTMVAANKRIESSRASSNGCTDLKVPFGEPSLTRACSDFGNHVDFEGLFGDAFVVCSVTFNKKKVAEFTDEAGKLCTGLATDLED